MTEIKLPKGLRGQAYKDALQEFADALIELDETMENKVSARGWCYLLEGMNLITKDQFSYVQKLINDKLRKTGLIPIDFVEVDVKRSFNNVEDLTKNTKDPIEHINSYLRWIKKIDEYKEDVAFWESQEYYIQMCVEKIDIRNLFQPICEKYHIPIANMVGWSDINSRNEIVERFKEAEELGLKPILLYYGDFDPAGILIADKFKKNLNDLELATNWNAENLIVDHFGITFDFIEEHNLTWIDNLTTASNRNLGTLYDKHLNGETDKKGKALLYPYEIEYIKAYGKRKCEANAVLPIGDIAKEHCEDKILEYLGNDCFEKYDKKVKETQDNTKDVMEKVNYKERIMHLMVDLKALKEEQNESD
jgi:hypothetical protein